jgi:hypothetical protein
MTRIYRIRGAAAGERGAVVVLFAVFAPVVVLFFSFVVDVGNSFVHARHLQVQADAGALAAAQEFTQCLSGSKSAEEAANNRMYGRAAEYGGASEVNTPAGPVKALAPLYNEQIGGTPQARIHGVVNNKRYYGQSSPVDGSAEEKPPCESGQIDLKLTETSLPWYVRVFKSVFNGVPYTDAHSRVEILQVNSARSIEPLAVAETEPVAAKAYFVNEDKANEVIASVTLANAGTDAAGHTIWNNAGTPLALAINKTNATTAHIGVKIALSGQAGDTKCGDPLVQCFDSSTGPLLHVAGYSEEGKGTVTAPLARRVTLSNPVPNTCTDGYFSNTASSCTFTVTAVVDYGSTSTKGVTVTPIVKGAKGSALTFNTTSKAWTGTATLTPASGSSELSLLVQCNPKAKESACPAEAKQTEATIADVHRIYAAGNEAASGTIQGLWLAEVGGAAQDANSFEVCEPKDGSSCTHRLVVTAAVSGSLEDAKGFTDPEKQLRFEGEQGVRVGCPPPAKPSGSEYRETIEKSCPGTYTVNTKDAGCETNPEPFECVTVGLPGKDTGPTQQGIDEKIEVLGGHFYCPNNWVNNNSGGVPLIPSDDSRILQLFVIPYGTLDSEGRSTLGREEVPIQNFAAFYVTGFPGDKCKGDPGTGNAEVRGHFIKYVTPNTSGGETKCTKSSFGECVVVLTR